MDKTEKIRQNLKELLSSQNLAVLSTHQDGQPYASLVAFKSKEDHTDRMLTWAKKRVKELEKEDLCGFIFKSDSLSSGLAPLVVPITLINHYVRKYDQPYLKMQTYLNPHPLELKLRTHV
jgi:uncharacterized protein YbgA (DUF1722 family)